ncbi:hypothetical protein Poli38472_012722 [Pythium oligandrum]|uniref:Uncharacterized protein n=1 Tax=Pythium oligandrum TaxID=41045 RepID=A0A8K1FGD5_PYTOL|nr:hypothetical protein Poli38472_012722 [Pythium oligandrum]|eukprot:TMW61531.1 hypothetical protein Poli38472_012722 [Pythium oligandrum]
MPGSPSSRCLYMADGSSVSLPRGYECSHHLLNGPLRRGKWTRAEEEYVAATIRYFVDGSLDLQDGTKLRGYLAQLLHCDPMRISKKLVAGTVFVDIRVDPKMGRRAYCAALGSENTVDERRKHAQEHLGLLREAFIWSIEEEDEIVQLSQHVVTRYESEYCRKRQREELSHEATLSQHVGKRLCVPAQLHSGANLFERPSFERWQKRPFALPRTVMFDSQRSQEVNRPPPMSPSLRTSLIRGTIS